MVFIAAGSAASVIVATTAMPVNTAAVLPWILFLPSFWGVPGYS